MLRMEAALESISGRTRGTSVPTVAARLNRGSPSTVRASAKRVASQASPPCGSTTRLSGSSARRWA